MSKFLVALHFIHFIHTETNYDEILIFKSFSIDSLIVQCSTAQWFLYP